MSEIRLVAMTRNYKGGPFVIVVDGYEEAWENAITEADAHEAADVAEIDGKFPLATKLRFPFHLDTGERDDG